MLDDKIIQSAPSAPNGRGLAVTNGPRVLAGITNIIEPSVDIGRVASNRSHGT